MLDSSVAIAWTFANERTDAVVAVLRRCFAEGVCVPGHWHLEIANVLRSAMRRGHATSIQRDGYLSDLGKLPTIIDDQTIDRAWRETVQISDRHGLTIYDAAYFEVALRRHLPLATLDKELIAAADAEGVPVLP